MNSNKGIPRTGCRHGSGFSLLELVVVIAIISVLLAVAIVKLWPLQVEAERVAMEHVLGSLRSALGIKVADYFVRNDVAGVRTLTDTNPMDRLSCIGSQPTRRPKPSSSSSAPSWPTRIRRPRRRWPKGWRRR